MSFYILVYFEMITKNLLIIIDICYLRIWRNDY